MKREYSDDGTTYHYPTSERKMICPDCAFEIGLAKKWHQIITCPACGLEIEIGKWKKTTYNTQW